MPNHPADEPAPLPCSTLELTFLALLFAGAFVLRLWGLSKIHFWDENVYLQNAELICCGKNNYAEIDSRPPLLPLLFAGIFHFWNSDYAAWIVTALLNALGPVFLYLGARKIAGRASAVIASLLLAFCPFFAGIFSDGTGGFVRDYTGHSLLTDCPALTLILMSFWLLLRALERQTTMRFACAGVGLALSVLMRFGSLSSVGILSLLVLAAHRRSRAAVACAAGFVFGLGPYLLWSRLKYGGFLATFEDGWGNFGGDPETFIYYFRNSSLIFSWVALLGLALCLFHILRRKSRDKTLLPKLSFLGQYSLSWESFLWIWTLAVMLFFSSLPHKEPRYAIPAAAPIFVLAGTGLSTLLQARRGAVRIAGTVALTAALAYTFWPSRHRFDTAFIDPSVSEEMQVSEFLSHALPPSAVLYCNVNYPDFAYYTNFQVEPIPESGPELFPALNALPSNAILIAYKQINNDAPVEPQIGWLDSNPHYQRLREFPSLVVYESHGPPAE